MKEISTKPYLIRAIYEWCADSGFTPYLAVAVDDGVRVPREFVKNGEIVLNIGQSATPDLVIDSSAVQFSARFGGVLRDISVPIRAVIGIYARENGQGLFFGREEPEAQEGEGAPGGQPEAPPPATEGGTPRGRPSLKVVK